MNNAVYVTDTFPTFKDMVLEVYPDNPFFCQRHKNFDPLVEFGDPMDFDEMDTEGFDDIDFEFYINNN